MSSAEVLLGVTSTILAIIGSSYTELALLNIVAKRPLLSCLLALGSPSIYMSRAFEYTDPAQLLRDRRGRLRQNVWKGWKLQLLLVAEYVVVFAAIGNIASIDWQLGVRTIYPIWSDNVIAPMLWSTLIIIGHIIGSLLPTPSQEDGSLKCATKVRFHFEEMVNGNQKDCLRMDPSRISIFVLSERHLSDCFWREPYHCDLFMDLVDPDSPSRHLWDDCVVQLVLHRTERRIAGDCSIHRQCPCMQNFLHV